MIPPWNVLFWKMLSLLNNEEISLPDSLLDNKEIFQQVLSYDTYKSLDAEEQEHLKQFLPSFAEEEDSGVNETVKMILDSEKIFNFVSPSSHLYEKLQSGSLSPQALKQFKKCKRSKYKNYKLQQKEYYKKLLEEIVASRQKLYDGVYRVNTSPDHQVNAPAIKSSDSIVAERIRKKYLK